MKKLVIKDNLTSLELVTEINKFRKKEGNKNELLHKNLLTIIRDEFEIEISRLEIQPSTYKSSRGKEYPLFILTLNQAKQVLMRESKFVRRAIIQYIEKLEQALKGTAKVEMTKLPFEYKVEVKNQSELIKIYQTENKTYYIKAKDLWRKLEINQYFRSWINKRIEKYDFIEEFDFINMKDDYALTLDMVKELCIIENTINSKLIKKYIIIFERHLKEEQMLMVEQMKERFKNKKVAYILNHNSAVRKCANEVIEFTNSLNIGKVITSLNKEKIVNLCVMLKAYAFPIEMDKKFGINEDGLIEFNYYPIIQV
ncbi:MULTISPECIES: antA/AntB antirepressor family protein [Fusobacterium]|jgi:hypothetical protein|uniref:antA/AntB antirepressor family protein n=1 Tax=Fusobacterium TaxID=848 RepID=UPI00044AA879|nr:antA/AntB antirepressor family protein [Fusobacterium sp. CM22]EUB28249.1 AntA/AntB antirepressor [Fusobacterium sp. CM22]DAJ58037.1 MAG TPA: KilAC domain protein [Caudoviricetes sp.]